MASDGEVLDSDGDLVQRAASGDLDAFTELFRRYRHVVYRFARAMTGCPAAAEDISQEVFVAVFRDLAKYDPDRATFTTYLYGIVRNLSRERLRKERRFFPLDVIGSSSAHAAYVDDPSDALEGVEIAFQVRRALQKLPPRYREPILLCDLHGFSYADAAVVIRISTSTVRSRLHRARQLLRQRLARVARPEVRRPAVQNGALYEL
jgi:RNA polymerase sigma-70 factor (ECF subfamily)